MARVLQAQFRLLTGKPSTSGPQGRALGGAKHVIGRSSALEAQHLEALVEWTLRCGHLPNDPFALRRIATGKDRAVRARAVTAKDVTNMIREVAVGIYGPGVPMGRIGSRGYRVNMATQDAKAGVPREETNLRGGWVPGSIVAESTYARLRTIEGTSATAAVRGSALGVEDVLEMAR
jgi:hypothetical protein